MCFIPVTFCRSPARLSSGMRRITERLWVLSQGPINVPERRSLCHRLKHDRAVAPAGPAQHDISGTAAAS